MKIPKKSDYLKSYQEEAEILKALENDEFYPKIYNYNLDYKVGHLELSLMGQVFMIYMNFLKDLTS